MANTTALSPADVQRVGDVLSRYRNVIMAALHDVLDRRDLAHAALMRYHFGFEDLAGTPTETSGGKLLRPALCLLCCEAVGGDVRQVVDYVRRKHTRVVLRGLRMLSDFEYEFQMALTNRKLSREVETLFLMPSESHSYVSTRLIKEMAALGADLSAFVPPFVEAALKRKLATSSV